MIQQVGSWKNVSNPRKALYGVVVAVGLLVILELIGQGIFFISEGEFYWGVNSNTRASTLFSAYTLIDYPPNTTIDMPNYPDSLETDRYGFIHNGRDREIEGDDLTIFVLGGSTVEGRGAGSNSRTICAYLERELRKEFQGIGREIQVINAGRVGFNAYQEFSLLNSKLVQDFNPDIVVSLSGRNDAFYLLDRMGDGWKRNWQPYYDQIEQKVNAVFSSPVRGIFSLMSNLLIDNSVLVKTSRDRLAGTTDTDSSQFIVPENFVELGFKSFFTTAYLSRIVSQSYGIEYLSFLQPVLTSARKNTITQQEQQAIDRDLWNYRRQDLYFPSLIKFFEIGAANYARQPWCYDISGIFLDCGETVYFDSCHYNNKGNEFIAEELGRILTPIISRRLADRLGG